MIKRSLLAASIAALTSQAAVAAPFMPMDARGLAMGNTGVASAKRAHAPAYNPSLLSQAEEDDDFALIFPQIGVNVSDEEKIADEAQDISDDIFPAFEDAIDGINGNIGLEQSLINLEDSINALQSSTTVTDLQTNNAQVKIDLAAAKENLNITKSSVDDLTSSLTKISGNPLSARLGIGGALAIPSKKFAAAISLSGSANVSARVNFSDADLELLGNYFDSANGFLSQAEDVTDQIDALQTTDDPSSIISELAGLDTYNDPNGLINPDGTLSTTASNPDLTSYAEIVAVSVVDLGLSFSREFTFGEEKVAIGITPKLQKISTYHYAEEVDGFEDVEADDLKDSREDYSKVNLDVGASWRFGSEDKWMLGLVGKNLLGGKFDYSDVEVQPKDSDGNPTGGTPVTLSGGSVSLDPQYRAGIAYNGNWASFALDVDLTENDPVAYENPTQYAALGVELDVFSTLQLRAGYRTNMSVTDADIVSVGFGLSPFGVHIDIAAMANPNDVEKEAGVALETGFYF